MAKTIFYLIRHGQSMGNLTHSFLGHTDLDLTELGYLQAEKCGEFLRDVNVDRIYASDLMRAYHTSLPTARLHGLEVTKKEALREVFAGEWENRTFDDIIEQYPEEYGVWVNDTGVSRPTGGERVKDLAQRFYRCLEEIAEENEGKTVFVFAHATPIRLMGALWQGKTVEEVRDIPWPANASVTVGEYENGAFSLTKYADCTYLSDLTTRLYDEA